MKRRILPLFLCLAFCLSLLPTSALAAENVPYIGASGETEYVSATEVTSSSEAVTWNTGWYYVSGSVDISTRITVSGNVYLILGDNATLNANAGITVSTGNTLNIYCQTDGTGTLNATASDVTTGYSGTGGTTNGSVGGDCGTITIYGGVIIAEGGSVSDSGNGGTGAGIGGGGGSGHTASNGGVGGDCGTVTIYSGTVTATAGSSNGYGGAGAGIGGGGGGGGIKPDQENEPTRGNDGTFSTTDESVKNGTAVIYAVGGYGMPIWGSNTGDAIGNTTGSDKWSGIIFQGTINFTGSTQWSSGQVYGDQTLEEDLTIESGQSLTVPSGTTLIIPEGVTATNNGTLTNSGSITGQGSLTGNGSVENTETGSITVSNNDFGAKVSLSITSDGSPATSISYNSTVTLTARVTDNNNQAVTTGTVDFYRGEITENNKLNTSEISVDSNGTAALQNHSITGPGWVPNETAYTIIAVYTPASGSSLLSGSDTATLTVSKASQTAPVPGVGYTIDYAAETISAQMNYELAEMDTASRGSASLTATPGGTVYVRLAETSTHSASPWTAVTIPTRPTFTAPSISFTDETIATDTTMEYSTNSGSTWTACTSENMAVTAFGWNGTAEVSVQFRSKAVTQGDNLSFASAPQTVTIPARPTITGLSIDNAAESVTIPAGYYYSTTSADYDDITNTGTGSAVTVAPGATIYIYAPASNTAFKSAVLSLQAPTQANQPTVSIDYANETVSTTTGMEWGVAPLGQTVPSQWTSCSDDMSLTSFNWDGSEEVTVYFRTAATSDRYASGSVSLTIPARREAPDVTGGIQQIGGLDTTMEYLAPASGEETPQWTAITAEALQEGVLSNLEPGTYQVRYAAVTGTSFASESITVQVTYPSSVSTYAITVESAENGTVTASASRAAAGSRVALTVSPGEGYVLDSLTVTDGSGSALALTETATGYTFTMPASTVTVTATFEEINHADTCPGAHFADVDTGAWYHDALDYVLENGLMIGTSDTTFEPGTAMNRAMLAQILYNMEGQPEVTGESTFTDVTANDWYHDAVVWAAENGIVLGVGDTEFGPLDAISREQFAVMLYRYADFKGLDTSASGDLSSFTDAENISDWAIEAVAWAVGAEVLRGYGDGILNPIGGSTRAEAAQKLYNYNMAQ